MPSSFFSLSRLSAALLAGALTLGTASVAFANGIGIVDLQKVLKSTVAGKGAAKKFDEARTAKEKSFASKEKELAEREKSLATEEQEIQRAVQAAKGQPSEELKQKYADFLEKVKKFQDDARGLDRKKAQAVEELAKKEQELLKPIEDEIRTKVAQIAKERSLSVVLSRQAAVYASDAVDITAEVIKRCDAK